MPTIFQFLQNPQIHPFESTLSTHPELLIALIDYLTKNPDPLIHNEQECYVYPNRAADILAMGTTYRVVIAKKERKSKKTGEVEVYYPYLERVFGNLVAGGPGLEDCLLGYVNKVLISLAKKTPQIYQYLKDNQPQIHALTKSNSTLQALKQFWITFLIESTMGLYVFLKNIVIRSLMFRIIDEKDTDNLIVYQTLYAIYAEMGKRLRLKMLPQDEKEELEEICWNFYDGDFVALLVLKISGGKSERSYYIAKLINQIIKSVPQQQPNHHQSSLQSNSQPQPSPEPQFQPQPPKSPLSALTTLTQSHIQSLQQYFQSYQDSEQFMDCILLDQIEVLRVLVNLSERGLLEYEYEANLMKRLLVYCSIHRRNSVLHGLMVRYVGGLLRGDQNGKLGGKQGKQGVKDRLGIFKQINVVPFFMKNMEGNNNQYRYAFGSLVYKICSLWLQNQQKLGKYVNEIQKKFIKQQVQAKSKKFTNLNFYKQSLINKSQIISQGQCTSRQDSPQKNVELLKDTQTPNQKQNYKDKMAQQKKQQNK